MTVDSKAGTALYDAIVAAADNLGQDDRPGRAIVVVTDGDDVSSLHSFNDAVRAAHKANAAIYAIGIAGPASTPATLRKLAAETGGSYRQASTSARARSDVRRPARRARADVAALLSDLVAARARK